MNILTTEDKARVFALYLGCEMRGYESTYKVSFNTLEGFCLDDFQLILKDLSDITDEDVLGILKVEFNRPELPEDVKVLEVKRNPTSIIYEWRDVKAQIPLSYNMVYPFADFLRKKKYMIPFEGKNLFDAGIAIRKTV